MSKKNKKPTMNEVKIVINNIIGEVQLLRQGLNQIDIILNSYINMNNDESKLKSFLEKEAKKGREENVVLPDGRSKGA